jgi:hypothetical protein
MVRTTGSRIGTHVTNVERATTGGFDIKAIADAFPEAASTLLVDEYLTNREHASARVFRVYRPTPAALSRDLRRVLLRLLRQGYVLGEGRLDQS